MGDTFERSGSGAGRTFVLNRKTLFYFVGNRRKWREERSREAARSKYFRDGFFATISISARGRPFTIIIHVNALPV